MKTPKIIYNFSRSCLTDLKLIGKAHQVAYCMGHTPNFPGMAPDVQTLIKKTKAFEKAKAKATDGSTQDTKDKNIARLSLEEELRQMAFNVQTESHEDPAMILSSGFDLAKDHSPVGPLKQPTGLKLMYGTNSGEVILKCDIIPKTRAYCFEYIELPLTPESNWIRQSTTKSQIELSGLKSGVVYNFHVAGIGSHSSRNWSEVLTKMVV